MIEIRKIEKQDIVSCVDIIKKNYNDFYVEKIKKEINASFIDSWINPVYYVCLVNDVVVSFGGHSRDPINYDTYGIFWINTDPEHRGKGYANLLVNKLIESIKKEQDNKPGEVLLTCSSKLKSYYEKFGFFEIMKRKHKDGYLMCLTI